MRKWRIFVPQSYNCMIKLPQGKSNFRQLVEEGFHYVDKTGYIRVLEGMSNSYLFYMRPRRFGKSLLVSMLMHYYGEQHRGDFERLFGAYDIGWNGGYYVSLCRNRTTA